LVEDDERSGCPKSNRNEVNIEAVADLVTNYCPIASRIIAKSLNIPKSLAVGILKEDLGKRNLCVRFVQHYMTTELQVFVNFLSKTCCYNPLSTPYSPDLSPPDYFLFRNLKMKLKEIHFADVDEIQEALTNELKKVPKLGIFLSFSETVRPHKSLYICQWSLF
jgi:hypothetical protein